MFHADQDTEMVKNKILIFCFGFRNFSCRLRAGSDAILHREVAERTIVVLTLSSLSRYTIWEE